ncbi:MAG: RNA polymerase sigma factor [Pseudomonadota bacterium]|jgi:RNA polymerase sigma factor (sigma-70 family)|nr:RNA polymerase sigma factor [Pseudomonadota bacterium]
MSTGAAREAIEAVWRIESPQLVSRLMRMVHDLGAAEELAHEAVITALERWSSAGIPENPAAWLMTCARNRALDLLRQRNMQWRKHGEIEGDLGGETVEPCLEERLDEDVGDDVLRLIFIACHPVLSRENRAALTLRLLGGLTTEEIARAFLVPEPTIAQRIVRAKRTLAEARVPFEIPPRKELALRLASVLEVIYLIFNEGYTSTQGNDWMRPELCHEAMRLGRILAGILVEEAEVYALLALMELHASRLPARIDASGAPALLLDQDRSRWDQLLLHRGLANLARAELLHQPLGPFALQAAIAACHARAHVAAETDWSRIIALYDALVETTQSPIVELNRAVAVSMVFGPAAGLEIVDALRNEPALKSYHLLPSVRGDFLMKLGRHAEAGPELERAAALTQNARERNLLLARANECCPRQATGRPV